jgi:nucleotide-binding universal stress UspA family protein
MHKKILIPSDGSELSQKAVDYGIAFAREVGAIVIFVTVNIPFHGIDHEPQILRAMPEDYQKFVHDYLSGESTKILQAAQVSALEADVKCETVCQQSNSVYRGIIETAESNNCDLIIMASHGRGGISAVILGSETQKVLSHSKIPVLVHR